MTGAHSGRTADSGEALDRLARHYGVLPDYEDVWGSRRRVADATKRGVLRAMGVACGDDAAVAASLAAVAAESRRLLDPVIVLREGADAAVPVHVPADLHGEPLLWEVIEEHGTVHQGTCTGADPAPPAADAPVSLLIEAALPPGYHRLRVSVGPRQADMSLIVAPQRCYLPEALASGERWWGLAAQLYSVRREHDWGMGDFSTLSALVDVCARQGADVLGVNPLHAMFPVWPEHSSPYAPSSRLFLNVLYIDPERVVDVTASPRALERMTADDTVARLEALQNAELVDYAGVAAVKLPVLELAFEEFAADPASLRYRQFQRFCDQEGDPLLRHALFEALHEHFTALDPEASHWAAWPRPYQDPASAAVARFAGTHARRVDFHRWLQWLADEQLGAAARRAEDQDLGVGLYLDLAVSVDRAGAETWCNRHLYALDASVGAPPDELSRDGQNWGLPPLNPRSLFDSGYALFIDTLRRTMRHAGALRIDHVMGLMRLFWIPADAEPGEGAYVRYPLDDLLGIVALESQRQRCMVIGEDLGTVPEGLFERLQHQGVLSYRVLYFEREDGAFRRPQDYPAQALVTVSTHDLPTLAGWWQGRDVAWRAELGGLADSPARQEAQAERARDRDALGRALAREGLDTADADHVPAAAVHRFVSQAPAMLMLVQLEDALGLVEQANLPGTLAEHPNWRRRLPAPVEALAHLRGFAEVCGGAAEQRKVAAVPQSRAPTVPRATYRLQLNAAFTFDHARELVPYLHELGISHAYASPYLQSRPGSTHGYDITDHTAIDAEIGSRQAHADWVAALHRRGMGHVLDIVPNHMGVMGADNRWWLDVLEHGEAARHSRYFDIDWHPSEAARAGKVLLPVLGASYGDTLDGGELVLAFDAADGRLVVRYYEHVFPVDPRQYPLVLDEEERADAGGEHQPLGESAAQELASLSAAFARLPRRSETSADAVAERYRDSELLRQRLLSLYREVPAVARYVEARVARMNEPRQLHTLLERQAWRLAHWRTASDEINYRRFFDINDLAGLRAEDPEVFEAVHQRVLHLVEKGVLSGLRVDHPDGLYDPAGYFERLRGRCAEAGGNAGTDPIYLVAEKILAVDEPLPREWDISGTTGYDFSATVNGVFVDPAGEAELTAAYADFVGEVPAVDALAYRCKQLVMRRLLAGELQVLGNRLHRIGQSDRRSRDYTRNSLVEGLREVVACFPVYRTYVRGPVVSEQDRTHIETALERARRTGSGVDAAVFDFIADVLLQRDPGSGARRQAMQDFTMKLQQFTAPVTAKGVEDTLFYRYARLLSLNDVGDEPERFGVSPEEFHRRNLDRLARWPDSMLSTSSHDSKRGEDVRARLNVLSELPDVWRVRLAHWQVLNGPYERRLNGEAAPSGNDRYFLYQTLLGTWPMSRPGHGEWQAYVDRIQHYMQKVVREAKEHSSWITPDEAYETALADFVAAILDPARSGEFLDDMDALCRRIAPAGLLNGLAQTLAKLTAPGVPDIYQGSELWNFSLVDPDNRRPVDFELRRSLLGRLPARPDPGAARQLLDSLPQGLPKLHVVRQVLALRAREPQLFARGDYLPLPTEGALARHLCAFARRDAEAWVVVVLPRLMARMLQCPGERPGEEQDDKQGEDDARDLGQLPLGRCWQDSAIQLPDGALQGPWLHNLLTGERHKARRRLPAAEVLANFPVAVLTGGRATSQGGSQG